MVVFVMGKWWYVSQCFHWLHNLSLVFIALNSLPRTSPHGMTSFTFECVQSIRKREDIRALIQTSRGAPCVYFRRHSVPRTVKEIRWRLGPFGTPYQASLYKQRTGKMANRPNLGTNPILLRLALMNESRYSDQRPCFSDSIEFNWCFMV